MHDSPYTYFTSDELHLGEISLECSRSGAAAAALWLTFQVLPLTPDGLGAVLRAGASRRAGLGRQAGAVRQLDAVPGARAGHRHLPPDAGPSCRRSTGCPAHVLDAGMALPADEALFVATYDVDAPRRSPRAATAWTPTSSTAGSCAAC